MSAEASSRFQYGDLYEIAHSTEGKKALREIKDAAEAGEWPSRRAKQILWALVLEQRIPDVPGGEVTSASEISRQAAAKLVAEAKEAKGVTAAAIEKIESDLNILLLGIREGSFSMEALKNGDIPL